MPSRDYLEVPKVLPHRKSRSRSRSRSRSGPVEVVAPCPIRARGHSPPIFTRTYSPPPMSNPPRTTYTNCHALNGNGHAPAANGVATVHTNGANGNGFYHDREHSTDLNGDFYTLAPSPSPPPELPLRQRLVGAWRLESYIAYPTPESPIQRPTYPLTKNVTGLILYTPDGYMSAQMLIPGQMSFKRGEGEEPQWAEASKRFFGYSGPYYISNEGSGREEVLRHTFQICNLPGWVGDVQVRTWKFEDDGAVLVLGSEKPTEIKGDSRIPVLKWRRAIDNTNSKPPPPMPQIKVSGPGEP